MQISSAELQDIEPPRLHRNSYFFLDKDENEIAYPGVKRLGPMAIHFLKDDRYDEFLGLFRQNEEQPFTIQFPDGTDWQFSGFVTAVKPQGSVDGLRTLSVDIKPTKNFIVNTRKEGRMFPKGAKHMPSKPAEGLKGFYIGSNAMPADWTHADLKTAIAHATELVNDREGSQEEVFIVKIVKVVKRKEAPVTVSNFKPFKAPRVKKTRG